MDTHTRAHTGLCSRDLYFTGYYWVEREREVFGSRAEQAVEIPAIKALCPVIAEISVKVLVKQFWM